MKKKQLFFKLTSLFFILMAFSGLSQNKSISGTITDFSSIPVPGVNVVVKATNNGTVTNFDGSYNISAAVGQTLVFSYLGFKTKEVIIGSANTYNVVLEDDVAELDAVVLVGYGTQKKSDITGSVVSVDQKLLQNRPSTNVEQLLQGNVAGLRVNVDGNGAEGSRNSLNVRGISSISAGNGPLIILDGVPFEGALSEINPNDIGSIEVLKDASSAAIYGARAANGVILINTKKGRSGEMTTSYSGFTGFDEAINVPNLLDGQTFYDLKVARGEQTTAVEDEGYAAGRNTDWLDIISRGGMRQEHNLSIRGGNETTKYYVSAGYTNVKGIAIGDEFSRSLFRVNLDHKLNDWLTFGTNTQYGYYDRSGVDANWGDAYRLNPLAVPYNEDGSMRLYTWEDPVYNRNPLNTTLYENSDVTRRFFTNNFLQVDFPFIEGLSFKLNTGYDFSNSLAQTYRGRDTHEGFTTNGSLTVNNGYNENYLIENILSYNKSFGDHNVFLTALYSIQNEWNDTERVNAQGFPNDVMTHYQADKATLIEPSSSYSENSHVSQMLRANYSYKSKYLLTFTVRRDGYSAFGADSKFGVFPSVAVGWNLSEENFLQDSNINRLKLRLSYGVVGNEAISPYSTLPNLSSIEYVDVDNNPLFGFYPRTIGDPSLGWETSKSFNVGVDFGLFNDRIRGMVDVYQSKTTDLLLSKSVSTVNGTSSITQNIGETKKSGIEFQITTFNISKPNFTWRTDFNFAHNKNEIVNVGLTDEAGNYIDDVGNRWFIGSPIDVYYEYAFGGIWQEDTDNTPQGSVDAGDLIIKDVNNDGEISTADRVIQGQSDPNFIAGMTNNLTYKNWNLSIFVNSIYGIEKPNAFLSTNDQDLRYNRFPVDYWTAENGSNSYPRNDRTQNTNSYGVNFFRDASFIRIQEVTLGYNFPDSLLDKLGFKSLQLYTNVKNPFTITSWEGLDPEFSNQLDRPQTLTYSLGMNFSF